MTCKKKKIPTTAARPRIRLRPVAELKKIKAETSLLAEARRAESTILLLPETRPLAAARDSPPKV
jgi:hypothetical protein